MQCWDSVGRGGFFELNKNNEAALAAIRRGFAGEELSAEVTFGGRDWMNFYVPRHDDNGAVAGLISVSVDITERNAAEDELRKVLAAVEQAPSSIVITDARGAIEYVNPQFTLTTGYSQNEVLGKNLRHPESASFSSTEYQELWETVSHGRTWQGELKNHRKDGTPYWERTTISPVRDTLGKIAHFIKVAEDVTESRRAGEERAALREQALLDRGCSFIQKPFDVASLSAKIQAIG